MSVFLQKFVDMHNKVTETGILCKIKGKELRIKPYIISCCVDAPARASVQGIKQYNGYYGCNWCIHPGWKEARKAPVTYPLLNTVPRLRTNEETVNIMTNCTESEGNLGIKYPSPLICLPHFDIIDGLIPDYMHCCLEGVGARMLNYFMQNMSDNTIEELNVKMKNIEPPDQLQRLTRPISEKDDWKAREWENFILYYSIPILKPVISEKKFNHWLLFVEGLYIILKDKIHISELNRANKLFAIFVADMTENHGTRAMTYNTHILYHICRSVYNWGPVWSNSTFCFESANQHVLNAIQCARGASHQVIRFVNLSHSLLILENSLFPIENQNVSKFCSEVLESKVKEALTLSLGITYLVTSRYIDKETADSLNLSTNSLIFYKMAQNGCRYESSTLKKKRSNNSYALLKDGTYIQILQFLVDEENDLELTQCYRIQTTNIGFRYAHMRKIDTVDKLIVTIPTTSIYKICIFIKMDETPNLICEMPNMLHY